MSRIYLSAIAAGAISLLGMQPAAAGCCNSWGGWSTGWGASWGTGCCASAVVAVQPVIVQPAPIVVQPAPIVVRPAPIVVVQQPLVQAYAVNQGPVYSGPGTDYSPSYYRPAQPVASYPYVGADYYGAPAYRPYRKYRSHWSRPYRPYYGVRKAHRWSGHHGAAPRHHGAPAPKYYQYK